MANILFEQQSKLWRTSYNNKHDDNSELDHQEVFAGSNFARISQFFAIFTEKWFYKKFQNKLTNFQFNRGGLVLTVKVLLTWIYLMRFQVKLVGQTIHIEV